MKITFLGTAAAEGIPSPFCNCSTCTHAREFKGRNIRKRTSILINNDLMIDMGPDLVSSCSSLSISINNLKYALITHSHFDHFYPNNLEIRSKRYRDDAPSLLTLVGGPSVLRTLDQIGYKDVEMEVIRVPFLPFNSLELPPYTVKSIAATHAPLHGDAMNYIIDDGENKILYATDTGIFNDKVWSEIEGTQFKLIIIDVTNGQGKTSPNHLNFEGLGIMLSRLKKLNALTKTTQVYATHFSHRSNPPHSELSDLLKKLEVNCSFDGLVLDL
jgi:phosphoribosyl 1,2-cyclic phosphate phosphodiesterase